jgi:hypothetical protein
MLFGGRHQQNMPACLLGVAPLRLDWVIVCSTLLSGCWVLLSWLKQVAADPACNTLDCCNSASAVWPGVARQLYSCMCCLHVPSILVRCGEAGCSMVMLVLLI